MKTARLFLMSAMAVMAAAGATIAGEWEIHRSAAGHESTQTCTFTQKDNDLGGTCSSRSGPVTLTGKIDGKKVTWKIQTESENGGPVTVVYTGTADSDKSMSGTVTAVEYAIDGEFKASRVK